MFLQYAGHFRSELLSALAQYPRQVYHQYCAPGHDSTSAVGGNQFLRSSLRSSLVVPAMHLTRMAIESVQWQPSAQGAVSKSAELIRMVHH